MYVCKKNLLFYNYYYSNCSVLEYEMVAHCWKDDGLKLLSDSLSFGAFAAAVKMSFYIVSFI